MFHGKAAQYGPYVDLDMFDGRKKDKGGKIIEKWAIKMREEVSPEHDFDLIIVSVNHQQWSTENIHPHTAFGS